MKKKYEGTTFSIVSPSFNQGEFIEETLQSVMAQNYPFIHHVVVDGGSTDGTLDILRRFEAAYPLEWISEPDDGLYDALNKALAKTRGEWIGWINCDDLYVPDLLHNVSQAIRKNPNVEIICGDAEVFQADNKDSRTTLYIDHHYRGDTLNASKVNLRRAHLNACFFKKSLIDRVGYFDTSFKILGDRDYMFRIMRQAPTSHHLDRVVYRYRAHPHSLTMSNVSATEHALLQPPNHPYHEEIFFLCNRYLVQRDSPKLIRQWCQRVLIKQNARNSVVDLRSGNFRAFIRRFRVGISLHPTWLYWFAVYVSQSLTSRL